LKRLIGIFLFLPCALHAIIPLPYSVDPPVEETDAEVATVDPATIPGYSELFSNSQLRAKELPTFGEQAQAVGYEPGISFVVPANLRARVEFWKKVYTVYTSSQAIIHDAENLEIQYGVVDLSPFKDPKIPKAQQRKRIAKHLKKVRTDLIKKLKGLHNKHDRPQDIPVASFALYRKLDALKDPKRFLAAANNIRTQVGQRDKVVQGFLFGGRYWNKMMDIFQQQGVPKELTRLPMVESAFDLSARSKVGASGVWQFMRATGKRYLRIDRGIDERNDPILAAWAAAELLRQNYETLEAWPLAITAYNHGREGMARAVRKLGTKDLVEIINRYDSSSFGFASSNFYSEFLAILEIERDYRKYFGTLMVDAPVEYDEVALPKPTSFAKLAERCGVKVEDLALLNPAFTPLTLSGKVLVPAKYAIKVPLGSKPVCGLESVDSERAVSNEIPIRERKT
jgi:membrane-bound lytic murein transglycosylase D